MKFAARLLPDSANNLTDEQCRAALEGRMGRNFDIWNCEVGDSLNSTTNVAATWPNTFMTDCQAAGKVLYLQIHLNQVPGSGTASDLKWIDLLDATRPNHAICVSQLQAYFTQIKTLGATAAYLCVHHEPEDDAQVNGFGAGDPILSNVTWQPSGAGNWTQPLTAQSGDPGQALLAAQAYGAFVNAAWALADGVGLTCKTVVNLQKGAWEGGKWGGGALWANAIQSALGSRKFIISTDAYTQPGADGLHIGVNGRDTPQALLATSMQWAIANNRKWAAGEYGVAPCSGHGVRSDPLSKAYHFDQLYQFLLANASHIEFFSLQGNVMLEVGGVWQGRHPYADWDDANPADATAALKSILTATALLNPSGDVPVPDQRRTNFNNASVLKGHTDANGNVVAGLKHEQLAELQRAAEAAGCRITVPALTQISPDQWIIGPVGDLTNNLLIQGVGVGHNAALTVNMVVAGVDTLSVSIAGSAMTINLANTTGSNNTIGSMTTKVNAQQPTVPLFVATNRGTSSTQIAHDGSTNFPATAAGGATAGALVATTAGASSVLTITP